MKYPLANDVNGNPIDVPENASAWRVRRAPVGTGRPQNVYDPESGRQLEIPLDATLEHLRQCGCGAGRYRLEAVDGESKAIPGIVAFTELTVDEPVEPPALDAIARLLETVEKQSDTLCRALEALSHAFGPVRPASEPVIVPQSTPTPAPTGDAFKPEKFMELIGMAVNAFKTGVAQGAANASAS